MISDNFTFTTITAGTGDEAGLAPATGLRLMGYSVRETAGSAATLNIEHGTANSSPILAGINLAADGVSGQQFHPQGLPVENGVWIERLTGTTEISLATAIL